MERLLLEKPSAGGELAMEFMLGLVHSLHTDITD